MAGLYRMVYASFWTGAITKALRLEDPLVHLVALYLLTSPHGNMIGLFRLPLAYMANDLGRDLRLLPEWIDAWLLSASTPIEVGR